MTEPDPTPELTTHGVGPHPLPHPTDPHFDPELLNHGDTRNVLDRYRYWSMDAIVADLDARRHPFHVAIENWQHDLNIGSIVRSANAFLAEEVHIVGRRRWNKRGAMVTDRYQHVRHHETIDDLVAFARERDLPIVAVDNVPGARAVDAHPLPEKCILLFGQEGPGLEPRSPRRGRRGRRDHAVRFDALHQRERRRRDRHARVGARPRDPTHRIASARRVRTHGASPTGPVATGATRHAHPGP